MAQSKRGFTYLVAGHIVSTLGSSIYVVALVLYLAELTDSPRVLGFVQFGAYLPAAILGPLVGALVDRWSRKAIIVWADLIRGAAMVAIALVGVVFGRIPVAALFGLTIAISVCGAFFVPAVLALIPDLVEPNAVKRSNGTRSASTQIANLIGSAVGGVLFALLGAPILFLVNGVSFVVSALWETAIHPQSRAPDSGEPVPRERVIAAAGDGLRYLMSRRSIRGLVTVQAATNLLLPPLVVALPFVISDVWVLPTSYFGYFFASVLAGGVSAFLLLSSANVGRRIEGIAYLSSAPALSVVIAGIGVLAATARGTASTGVIVGLFFLFAIAGGSVGALHLIGTTRLQQAVPANLRGRVFAASETAVSALLPFAYALSGIVAHAIRSRLWLLFVGVATAAACLGLLTAMNGALRRVVSGSTAEARLPTHQKS